MLNENWYTESIKEWIHRGADNFISSSINSTLDDLVKKNLIKEKSMMDLLMASYKEATYEFGDIIWGSAESKQLADLMVYWKSGTDTVSHEFGPHSTQVKDEIDEAVMKLAETIKFYKMYSSQPVYVVITADHSQSVVTEFSGMIEDFKRIFVGKFKVAGRDDLSDFSVINNSDIIVANNDRAAFFYIFGQSLQPKNQTMNEIIAFLKNRKEVDLIFSLDETIHVIQILNNGSFVESSDVDDFFKDKDNLYPKGAERIKGLMEGKNWGDIVISVKEGYSLNPEFKPLKEGEKILHGDHGGLNFSDSIVPLLFWGPTIKANVKDGNWETYRTVDIAPTIAAIFDEKHKVTDGRSIKEILEKRVNRESAAGFEFDKITQ